MLSVSIDVTSLGGFDEWLECESVEQDESGLKLVKRNSSDNNQLEAEFLKLESEIWTVSMVVSMVVSICMS